MSSKKMDARSLATLERGAKTTTGRGERPWDRLDPTAPADRAYGLATNAYQRAVLKYLGVMEGTTMQAVVSRLIREAAEKDGE